MLVGGANHTDFFTAFESNGVPLFATTTVPLISLTKKIKTSVTRTNFTIDQNEDDPALTAFLTDYAPQTQAASDSGEYEDGVKFNSATASSQTLGKITYGSKYAGTNPAYQNKRKVVIMLCKLAQDVGAFDMESGKYTKPKVGGEIVNNDSFVTVPATAFQSKFVTLAPATFVTIPEDRGYVEVWLTASA
jgi:hypothetical protein